MAKRLRKTLPKDWEQLCETASVEELKEVLSGCQVDAVDDRFSRRTAWMLRCTPMEVVEWLVRERGADINQVGGYKSTALSENSYDWLTDRMRALVALGADVNGAEGEPPLVSSCRKRQGEAVRTLIELGADVERAESWGSRPLDSLLRNAMNADLPHVLQPARLLLDSGVVPTDAHRREVTRIGQDFEFFRQGFSPEFLEEAETALRGLYELFGVTPVRARLVHDGVSPIVLEPGSWQQHFDYLWELMVPASGVAGTCQGEVIRVAGRVSDEVCRNGGCNWSARHRRMLGDYRRILAYGAALEPEQLEEARTICQRLPSQDSDVTGLMRLAVEWVRRNPEPLVWPLQAR